ncbi:MAG: type IX secretion system membrane protein PorP/SprF [Cytophagaceae bacterium]
MLRVASLYLLFILCIRAFGQNSEVLPVQFDQFYQNYSLIHPAATGMNYPLQVAAGHRALTGIFKGVNSSYIGVNAGIFSKDSTSKDHHGTGINIINSQEGPYITRTRLYASYAWHNQVGTNWHLSAGIMLGLINHNYKPTDISAGGSVFKPTGDVGLVLYNPENLIIGATVSQFVGGNMEPLEPHLNIKRHMTLSLQKKFEMSPYISLWTAWLLRTPVNNNSYQIDGSAFISFHDVISCGLNYKVDRGISYILGVRSTEIADKGLDIFISYYTPFNRQGNLRTNIIELSLMGFIQKP